MNWLKPIASATIAAASALVSGSKFDRNVPVPAMSRSPCLSYPRWIASSGRWNSSSSQFFTYLRLSAGLPRASARASLRPRRLLKSSGASAAGSTVLAVMSSSVCTFTAGEKSGRSENSRHEPSSSKPTRSMFTTTLSPSSRTMLPWRPLMMLTEKWLRQSSPHSGWW